MLNVRPTMTLRPTQLERAFELAASGRVESVGELRRTLKAEGYPEDGQLFGKSIQMQLQKLIAAARTKATD